MSANTCLPSLFFFFVQEVQSLEAEIETLRNLRHDRIVMYYGTERTADSLCIFMEYISGVSCLGTVLS